MRIAAAPLELNQSTANDPARIDKVARQLEGQFAQMLIKSMREASFGDSLFPGENQMFREMYDQRIAEAMTRGRGMGLSAMIARQLGGGDTTTQALDPAIKPEAAARAYRLASPEGAALPLHDSKPVLIDPLQDLPGEGRSALLEPQVQALDLIAGRESSNLHAALGGSNPYQESAPLAAADWAALSNDRWSNVSAAERGDSVDTRSADAATAQLGAHTPEGFVASVWPHAERAARELGVDPRALVAQAALETGWGKRHIKRDNGSSSHNLFGIKATGNWEGGEARAITSEFRDGQFVKETAAFRSYDSYQDSFHDLVSLLQNNSRYQDAVKAADKPEQFVQELQKAGYATDPNYASKISQIARQMKSYEHYAMLGTATKL